MQDANTEYLNRYLNEQQKQEEALEAFTNEIQIDLLEIQKLVYEMEVTAKNYQGYDFREDLKEILNDTLLWKFRKVTKWK